MRRLALALAAVAMLGAGGCAVYGPDYRYDRPYGYYDYSYYEPGVVVYPSITVGGVYYRDSRRGRHWRSWRDHGG